MHDNEFEINLELVQKLLKSQCPHYAHLPLQSISSSGTDNALFRLGQDFVVRLPRLPGANSNICKEWNWLPKLASLLTISISEPVFKGEPEFGYPSLWSIAKWNEGSNPEFEKENEYKYFAKELAGFINELHNIPIQGAPISRRGVPLKNQNDETRLAISELQKDIDIRQINVLWGKLSETPSWQHAPVWIHGDLLPGNLLIQNNHLSAVIDFSDVGIGDPACDLIPGWCLFSKTSREIFKNHLLNLDENTWRRAQGWALSIALIILPYYKFTNPVLASVARNMINNILEDAIIN